MITGIEPAIHAIDNSTTLVVRRHMNDFAQNLLEHVIALHGIGSGGTTRPSSTLTVRLAVHAAQLALV